MVSAIITTHNRCKSVLRAIDSVKKQTYRDIEIIVVDDSSTDNTQLMLKKMTDIHYIRIEQGVSKGGNHARNVGISVANGKYIAFLDDDDVWYPQKTELQVNVLDKNSDIGMVYCNLFVNYRKKYWNYMVWFDKNVTGDLVKKQCYWHPICTTSAMIMRADILKEIGGFDEKVAYWQEYELSLRLIQKCKIGLVSKTLVEWTRSFDNNQMTNQYNHWEKAVHYIAKKHKEIFKKLDEKSRIHKLETYYKEAAFRTSAAGNKKLMREYYKKAFMLTKKLEYIIRWKFNLSRQDTVYFEIIIKKIIYIIKKSRDTIKRSVGRLGMV